MSREDELAILTWMANPADTAVMARLLQQSGVVHRVCGDLDSLLAKAENCGALLLEEESLTPPALERLTGFLDRQPPWSELPVVLLVRKQRGNPGHGTSWSQLIRNLTLVERPIASASLVSILQTALQARRRQYEVRDLLTHLEDLNASLEGRVAERTSELKQRAEEEERLATELARSNKELEQFAYIASHDLQAPLRSVTGFLDLLSRRYKNQLGPEADEFIGYAVQGAERMYQLINDILAYSRVGTREASFKPTACREVLDEALANLRSEIDEKRAEITYNGLPTVIADRNQLVQLLQNLIGNALKYRKADEPPRIHVGAESKEIHWELQVRDNGIGIPANQQERIFQIFQRLHAEDEYPGTGIGLALCKKIVDRHAGRIWVESEPGKGSAFHFTLPKV